MVASDHKIADAVLGQAVGQSKSTCGFCKPLLSMWCMCTAKAEILTLHGYDVI